MYYVIDKKKRNYEKLASLSTTQQQFAEEGGEQGTYNLVEEKYNHF